MRYSEADLVSEQRALQIIALLDRWCRRTGTTYNRFVTAARVPPSTRSKIKQGRLRLTITLADRITRTMDENPRGITKGQQRVHVPRHVPAPILLDRSPCLRCGVRKDIGCGRPACVPS
jgi:hypothetical protein